VPVVVVLGIAAFRVIGGDELPDYFGALCGTVAGDLIPADVEIPA
jgi:hypothetical protein